MHPGVHAWADKKAVAMLANEEGLEEVLQAAEAVTMDRPSDATPKDLGRTVEDQHPVDADDEPPERRVLSKASLFASAAIHATERDDAVRHLTTKASCYSRKGPQCKLCVSFAAMSGRFAVIAGLSEDPVLTEPMLFTVTDSNPALLAADAKGVKAMVAGAKRELASESTLLKRTRARKAAKCSCSEGEMALAIRELRSHGDRICLTCKRPLPDPDDHAGFAAACDAGEQNRPHVHFKRSKRRKNSGKGRGQKNSWVAR